MTWRSTPLYITHIDHLCVTTAVMPSNLKSGSRSTVYYYTDKAVTTRGTACDFCLLLIGTIVHLCTTGCKILIEITFLLLFCALGIVWCDEFFCFNDKFIIDHNWSPLWRQEGDLCLHVCWFSTNISRLRFVRYFQCYQSFYFHWQNETRRKKTEENFS